MTITLLAPDGVAVTAMQERQARAAGHGGGSGRQLGGRSGFRVGTPSTALTATSTTWTLTPCAAMIDPGASTHQGMYGWATDQNVTGTVTAADATNPRKDIVYIQVNDSSAGDGSGAVSANVLYLAGTPGVTPSAPTLPARSFLVGTITVPQLNGGAPTVVRNPAVHVAAGAPLPVDQAARDLLDKYDTLTVQRTDLPGRPFETWDGGKWNRFLPAINNGDATNLTSLYAGWTIPFSTGNRRPRVWSPDGVTVHLSGVVQYVSGAANIITIPAPFAPNSSDGLTYVGALVTSSGPLNSSPGQVIHLGIDAGALKIVYQGGSIAANSYVPLNGTWRISG